MKILFRTLLVLAVMAAVAAVLVQVLHMADRDTCSAPESLTPDAGRLPAEAAEMIARKGLSMPAIKGPIFNYDCTQFFTDREMLRLQSNPIEEGVDGGALVDGYVDHLAGAGVTVMMININARRTNYRSAVWESFWDGYDPNGPDDQPFLAPLPEASRTKYRQVIHSMWALDQQGVDYPARVIARCRERGISPWVSIRMNDCHYPDDLEHPFHGSMWRRGDLFRGAGGGVSGYYARCLDYAQPEVRDLYRALIEECVQRYDVDGIELDFLREPYLFKPGAEEEGAKILHKWIREIRRLTERAGAERGRPIRLGVRVPSCVETARSWGLDAVTWAREGLVDLVVPAPRWATIQFDMPLDKWREALDGTGVSLAGGLEFSYRPHRNAPFARASVEQSVGAATAVLAAGADAVYLFNIFDYPFSHGPLMRAMASIETLLALPRRHAITYREVIGRGEDYRPPLPAEGTNLNFQIFTGPQPGKKDEVTLLVTGKGSVSVPAATVNNVACKLLRRISEGGNTRLEYRVPVEALPGNRRDAITLAASEPITVLDVQIRIVPPVTAQAQVPATADHDNDRAVDRLTAPGVLYTGKDSTTNAVNQFAVDGTHNGSFVETDSSGKKTQSTAISVGPNARFGTQAFTFTSSPNAWNSIDISGSLCLGSQFTIAAYVNPDKTTGRIMSTYPSRGEIGSNTILFDFFADGGTMNGMRFAVNGVIVTPASPVSFNDGEWHHLAATYDNGAVALYLDGVEVGSGTAGAGTPVTDGGMGWTIQVGADPAWGTGNSIVQFIGDMDDVLLFPDALSPEDIMSLKTIGAQEFFSHPSKRGQ